MKQLLSIFVVGLSFYAMAGESLSTKVTLDSDSALEFYDKLNAKEEVNEAGKKTAHSKSVSITTDAAGQQLYVRCSYLENGNAKENATCTFNFYVNHPTEKK